MSDNHQLAEQEGSTGNQVVDQAQSNGLQAISIHNKPVNVRSNNFNPLITDQGKKIIYLFPGFFIGCPGCGFYTTDPINAKNHMYGRGDGKRSGACTAFAMNYGSWFKPVFKDCKNKKGEKIGTKCLLKPIPEKQGQLLTREVGNQGNSDMQQKFIENGVVIDYVMAKDIQQSSSVKKQTALTESDYKFHKKNYVNDKEQYIKIIYKKLTEAQKKYINNRFVKDNLESVEQVLFRTEVLDGDYDMNFEAGDDVATTKANTQPVGKKILPATNHFGKTILSYDDDVGAMESDSDNDKTLTPKKRMSKQRKHKASSVNNNSPEKHNKHPRPRRKQTRYDYTYT